MPGVPLPVVAMALAGGAVVVVYGSRNVKTAIGNAGSTSTTGSGSATAGTATAEAPSGASTQATVNSIAATHGWDASEVTAWLAVIADEDNMLFTNVAAGLTNTNPSSGAYGFAQFIQGPSEYAQYGGSSSTLEGQLTAMANYIAQRYGTPSAALAHENASHWY